MREIFEAALELASETMTMEDLAASSDFSIEQKGTIFQKILAKQSTLPALPAGTPPPPDSHDQEMLAPLSAAPDDAAQLIKNRESARALEQSHTSAPLLGSAMEIAARGLSISGSLPPNTQPPCLMEHPPRPSPAPAHSLRCLIPRSKGA